MVTFVGIQSKLEDALKDLVELDYDAVEAYEAAINRIESQAFREKLEEFRKDNEKRINELSNILGKHNIEAPTSASTKQWLTKGKVVLANMLGDSNILAAIASNEEDTNTAYESLCEREDLWEDVQDFLKNGLEDARKHKAWLDANS